MKRIPFPSFSLSQARRLTALLAVLLLSWSALAVHYPVTVVDDLGREVTLEAAPQRVVSMIPSSTEIICALDACDLLVGVDEFSNYPAQVQELPDMGSAFTPNLEAIVALEPDLVLAEEYSGIVGQLENLGIPVYSATAQTLDQVWEVTEALGLLLDREIEAALLEGRVTGELQAIGELVEGGDAPTVFVELDATPFSAGPGSYIDELVQLAGGENILDESFGDFPQVDPEYVVAADPQVVLLFDAPFGETAATVEMRPGWSGVAAVREGRVIELTQEQVDMLSRPGPRLGQAVAFLARVFHPDRF